MPDMPRQWKPLPTTKGYWWVKIRNGAPDSFMIVQVFPTKDDVGIFNVESDLRVRIDGSLATMPQFRTHLGIKKMEAGLMMFQKVKPADLFG